MVGTSIRFCPEGETVMLGAPSVEGRWVRRPVVHSRYQHGHLQVRGKRRKVWVARWREDVIRPDGTLGRVLRSTVLGKVTELSKKQAKSALDTLLRPVNQGLRGPQSTITFAVFVSEHFDTAVLPTLKISSRDLYSYMLRKHLVPRFGTERLCDISRMRVQQFLLEKLKTGLAWNSVSVMRVIMGRVMGTAVEWGLLTDNPAHRVKMPEKTAKVGKFLGVEEVRLLVQATPDPLRTMILLAVMTGMRIGEIIALRWTRVDLVRGILLVAETCHKGNFGTPKTKASRREIPLAPSLIDALRRVATDSDFVFARGARPLAYETVKHSLGAASKSCGIGRIGWHALRHTHGTLLHAQGTSLKVAQAQLGHSSMTTTLDIYTHAPAGAQREAVDKLEGFLFPKRADPDDTSIAVRSGLILDPNGPASHPDGNPTN